jgi:hypothetical protein
VTCSLGERSSKNRGLLFGDSFAGHYEPLWDVVGKKANVSIDVVTTNWCYPSTGDHFTGPIASRAYAQCLFNRKYLFEKMSSYDFVIFSGMWTDVHKQNRMSDVFDLIATAAKKNRLVDSHYRKSILFNRDFSFKRGSQERDKLAVEIDGRLAEISKKYPNVIYLRRDSLFNVNGLPSNLTNDSIPFSLDGAHISVYGSKMAAKTFLLSQQYQDLHLALKRKNNASSSGLLQ